MIANGETSVSIEDILYKVSEADIIAYYLNIHTIPCVINSPLREDKNPSFGIYSPDGVKVYYTDLSTRDRGGIFDLLGNLWHCNFKEVLHRVSNDLKYIQKSTNLRGITQSINSIKSYNSYKSTTELQCKIRDWKEYDLEYWGSYGISIEWLKYAEVYPISHKIIIKNNQKYVLPTDKYAYAYIERKEDKVTIKIYQPFNKNGYKWSNKHDSSVISLWTKIPKSGKIVCICSSVKDALCLWANTGIPSIAIQGEGYKMSDTAITELKKRFKTIFVCLDNDPPGILDAQKLTKETGFTNIILPKFEGGKDISDLYKSVGKEHFIKTIKSLFIK